MILLYALGGFFLAPWLLEKNAVESVRSEFGAELGFVDVSINPFVLSLQVDGLELDAPDGEPFLTIDQVYVNFQASSLLRWAWTFREFHINGPEVFLERSRGGRFSFDFLMRPAADDEAANKESGQSEAPRLLIADFGIFDSVVRWSDFVPVEPVATQFGPVNIAITELNTLPDRSGQQDVVITTETQGTLSWSGSLHLNPLLSEGHASVKGSHFPLTSAYLKHEAGFEVIDGEADVELDYRIAARDDGTIEASISNFDLEFSGVSVRTFNAAFDRPGEDRDVLTLPRMSLAGGEMRWPDRVVSAQSLNIDEAVVELLRDSEGALNVLPPESDSVPANETPPAGDPANGDPWELSLEQFRVNRLRFDLEDESVTPVADIGWRSLDVDVRDISNRPGARLPVSLAIEARDGGRISATGITTVLPQLDASLDLRVDGLALAGAHPYLKPLADVNLDSGSLNIDATISSSPQEPFRFEGDAAIIDFLVTETDEGSRLGSWTSVSADSMVFSMADQALEVSEIRLLEPYGDILIAEDGSINLGRVQKEAADSDEPTVGTEAGTDADSEGSPIDVVIGRVTIEDGAADFADRSLPLPFSAVVANLNGDLTTIATASSEPSTVSLEGKVDEFGQVVISGSLTPLDPPANTDIRVVFENVDMPKFSAYSIPFAGREIASGRLDLDLGYKMVDGALEGENKVVLRDFELGESVEHPGALSLPLGLAVALLKDSEGRINIDVPVRGDVNDPEFKYSRVVSTALINLLTRIITSPFALLANLVGAEADELEYISFDPGRSDLAPPEVEKTVKIAEALSLRPELSVGITGVYAQEADALAIRTDRVDALVASRMSAAEDEDDALFAERRLEVIEQLFSESDSSAEPLQSLEALRIEHTTPGSEESGPSFDALAYTEALRRRLIDAQPVAMDELVALAAERAAAVREAIAAADPVAASRVRTGEPMPAESADGPDIRMQVQLAAGGDPGLPAPRDNPAPVAASFACADGPTLTVRFDGQDSLQLDDGSVTLTLSRIRSASGARYAADGIEFWDSGAEATFTRADASYRCARQDGPES